MKKGFLFSSTSETSPASETLNSVNITPAGCDQKTRDENIPYITLKKDFTDSQHRFDEVQQAMQINDAFAVNRGDLFYNMDFQLYCIFCYIFIMFASCIFVCM